MLQRCSLRKHHGKRLEGAGHQESGMRAGVQAASILCWGAGEDEGDSSMHEVPSTGMAVVSPSVPSSGPGYPWGQGPAH